jgi:hypothetical protein
MRFSAAVGWLGVLVLVLPIIEYHLMLLGSRRRVHAVGAVWCGMFGLGWFLAGIPVVALLWAVPPFARAVVAALVGYLVTLAVPVTSSLARYPLHVIRCRRLPVVATTFAGAFTYTAPGSPDYGVSFLNDRFFRDRTEAEAAGFSEAAGGAR